MTTVAKVLKEKRNYHEHTEIKSEHLSKHSALTQMPLNKASLQSDIPECLKHKGSSPATRLLQPFLLASALETGSMMNGTRFKVRVISWILRFAELK